MSSSQQPPMVYAADTVPAPSYNPNSIPPQQYYPQNQGGGQVSNLQYQHKTNDQFPQPSYGNQQHQQNMYYAPQQQQSPQHVTSYNPQHQHQLPQQQQNFYVPPQQQSQVMYDPQQIQQPYNTQPQSAPPPQYSQPQPFVQHNYYSQQSGTVQPQQQQQNTYTHSNSNPNSNQSDSGKTCLSFLCGALACGICCQPHHDCCGPHGIFHDPCGPHHHGILHSLLPCFWGGPHHHMPDIGMPGIDIIPPFLNPFR